MLKPTIPPYETSCLPFYQNQVTYIVIVQQYIAIHSNTACNMTLTNIFTAIV